MASLTLLPLAASELKGNYPKFFERCFNKDFASINKDSTKLIDIIAKASFPELINMQEDIKQSWFNNYIEKVTLHDPHNIYNLEKAEFMPILLQTLASLAGNLINDANISREIGLNAVTARMYRNLLSGTFITYQLRPWYRNINKRLVKSHKIYFYDTMLLCHLLKVNIEIAAKAEPRKFGHILENFVLSELAKINHITGDEIDISFYRTNDGREIDFVLEKHNKLVALEVKNAEIIKDKDLSGIKELQNAVGKDFICGIILCNTKRVIAYDKDIYLLPFSVLWQ